MVNYILTGFNDEMEKVAKSRDGRKKTNPTLKRLAVLGGATGLAGLAYLFAGRRVSRGIDGLFGLKSGRMERSVHAGRIAKGELKPGAHISKTFKGMI